MPFHDRFITGDVKSYNGVGIRLSGRNKLWGTTWTSAQTSPIIGHGAGSSDALITNTFVNAGHPHNDYLRLLNDYGLVGLLLGCLGAFSSCVPHIEECPVASHPRANRCIGVPFSCWSASPS